MKCGNTSVENVGGAFDVADRLYGLTFVERKDLPKYHPEVERSRSRTPTVRTWASSTWTTHPRPGKRGGAWSGRFRQQWIKDGKDIRPVVVNVCNFTRPTGDAPALLSLEEVETLFHEFGHALHSLFSRIHYRSLADSAARFRRAALADHGALGDRSRKCSKPTPSTGRPVQPIPDELVAKIQEPDTFNQGFTTVEYLAASFLDMDWHTLARRQAAGRRRAFEKASHG